MNAAPLSSPEFRTWFGRSVVHEPNGEPTVVWRGEHCGHSEPWLRSRLGSLSFGSRDAACIYARSPNDRSDVPAAPRVSPWLLSIARPVMNDPDDPFVDLSILIAAMGREKALEIALRHADSIAATGNWEENYADEWQNDVRGLLHARPDALDHLYFVAYRLFDDHAAVAHLRLAGFDGAVCGGWGENALEPEWRLFDASNALPALCWRQALSLERFDVAC